LEVGKNSGRRRIRQFGEDFVGAEHRNEGERVETCWKSGSRKSVAVTPLSERMKG
jgi:hypothetical protein